MTALQASSQEELRRVIDRLERLQAEIDELKADFSDSLKNAGQKGFDTKIIRRVLSIRKKDRGEYDEEQAALNTYLHALSGTPMGDYIAREDEAKAKTIARAHGIPTSIVDELVERAP